MEYKDLKPEEQFARDLCPNEHVIEDSVFGCTVCHTLKWHALKLMQDTRNEAMAELEQNRMYLKARIAKYSVLDLPKKMQDLYKLDAIEWVMMRLEL